MKRATIVALMMLMTLFCRTDAQAYLYNWTGSEFSISDPDDTTIADGQDMLKVWYTYSNGFHHFRMDLQAAPSYVDGYVNLYGIYINSKTGGVDGGPSVYIPASLSGIDQIVDTHFDPFQGGVTQHDYHFNMNNTNPSDWSLINAPAQNIFQTQQNASTLEWMVRDDEIGVNFIWWAATHDYCALGQATRDLVGGNGVQVSGGQAVPIPGAVWLLGSGLLGLVGVKRRFEA